ncbi:unnamed protein product, partial [Vicia faba]
VNSPIALMRRAVYKPSLATSTPPEAVSPMATPGRGCRIGTNSIMLETTTLVNVALYPLLSFCRINVFNSFIKTFKVSESSYVGLFLMHLLAFTHFHYLVILEHSFVINFQ